MELNHVLKKMSTKYASTFTKSILNDITGVKVIDSYNIQFKLKRENKVFYKRISEGKLLSEPRRVPNADDKFTEEDTNILYFTRFGFSYKEPNRNFGHFQKGSYFTYESTIDPKFDKLYQLPTKYTKETAKYTNILAKIIL